MPEEKRTKETPEEDMLLPSGPRRGRGPVTGVDLSDLDALRRPFCQDPFFHLRPPLRQEALLLSLELAAMTYRLDLDAWMDAGWRDVSIQTDNLLQTGKPSHGPKPLSQKLRRSAHSVRMLSQKGIRPLRGVKILTYRASRSSDELSQHELRRRQDRARSALRERNPIQQVLGALRQRERSDTIKAVILLRRQRAGRYIVAIGFMGTGSRFYDWFSNFRFTTEEGFHKGFAQLTEAFERSAERIVFPDTAAEMGLETLTLADILVEMRRLNSRFFLWMAGHSQGAAVMQILCHKLMNDWHVLPQNMLGYGFASPTVATGRLLYDPAGYPLYHVLNDDDLVPRLGALLHLGLCLEYRAGSALRRSCYGWNGDEAAAALRESLEPFLLRMTDTLRAMEICVAFCYCLLEEKAEENLNALMDQKWSFFLIDRMLAYAGGKAKDMIEAFSRHARNGYRALAGRDMDGSRIAELKEDMRPMVRQYTLRQMLSGLSSLTAPPHTLTGEPPKRLGAYSFIATSGFRGLMPYIWVKQKGGLPVRRFAEAALRSDVSQPLPSFRIPAVRKQKSSAAYLPKGPIGRGIGALRRGNRAQANDYRRPASKPVATANIRLNPPQSPSTSNISPAAKSPF